MIFALALVAGVGLGYLAGGRLRALAGLRLRALPVLWLALALQLSRHIDAIRDGGVCVVPASYALIGVWLVLNVHARAPTFALALVAVAVGRSLNLAVIVANGAMPVSTSGLPHGTTAAQIEDGRLYKHVALSAGTRLRWLGDVIALQAIDALVSVGDIFLWAGVIALIATGMQSSHGVARWRWRRDTTARNEG